MEEVIACPALFHALRIKHLLASGKEIGQSPSVHSYPALSSSIECFHSFLSSDWLNSGLRSLRRLVSQFDASVKREGKQALASCSRRIERKQAIKLATLRVSLKLVVQPFSQQRFEKAREEADIIDYLSFQASHKGFDSFSLSGRQAMACELDVQGLLRFLSSVVQSTLQAIQQRGRKLGQGFKQTSKESPQLSTTSHD